MPPAPKPAPTEKAPRKSLRSKTWLSNGPRKPLKKSGETKAKKVIRQKEFYASATWRRLKKEAKDRAGNQCEYIMADYCGSDRCLAYAQLQVHHKTNMRFGGNEIPEDFQVLCKYHHELVKTRDHPIRKRR